MSYISGAVIANLANAVRSLEDAGLQDECQLYARVGAVVMVPVLAGDDEEPDRPMTVGDLKAILAPFAAWF